jgi:hypothetical protein
VPKVGLDLRRVALATQRDEALNPVKIGLLGARAVGFDADAVADVIEETSDPFHINL